MVWNIEDQATLKLRELYEQYGYRRYKMARFEEYGFYLKHKDFLPSEQMVVFTDLDGRLLALKPDVTLSIAKRVDDQNPANEKIYYTESIYRASKESRTLREITQIGLEYIGEIDDYAIAETVVLAAGSLRAVSEDFILQIGDMDVFLSLVSRLDLSFEDEALLLSALRQKSPHLLEHACRRLSLGEQDEKLLLGILSLFSTVGEQIGRAHV
jgi:ATP phosphoribosyltransferase regulatory subunit